MYRSSEPCFCTHYLWGNKFQTSGENKTKWQGGDSNSDILLDEPWS